MRISTLARRYAGALFGSAKSANLIDKVESDLGLLAYSLQTMPRLQEALSHPLVPAERKKEIAAEVFGGKVQEVTLHFLDLLIDKRREEIVSAVEQEYVRLANEFQGIVPALVTSAVPLTDDEKKQLQRKLEEFTGKKIELEFREDKNLIGGLIVKIGDTVMDGSVTGYLHTLKEKLLK